MALLKRSRPVAAPVTTPQQAVPRRAIMRRTTVTNGQAEADAKLVARQAVIEDLKLISKNNAVIDAATFSNDEAHARIEALMKQNKLDGITDGKLIAEIIEVFSKSSTFIDPQRFFNAVHADDFWSSISVSVTEARRVLAEKELKKIAKTDPPKSQGFKLRVKEYKVETTRKAK